MEKTDISKLREETRTLFKQKFGDIVFHEGPHKYFIGETEYTPVSTIISQYENEFDEDEISAAYALKHGRTQEDVLLDWKWTNKCATIMGTRAHEFGESYTNILSGHPELICEQNKPQYLSEHNWLVPTFPQEFAIKSFYDNLNQNLHPIGAEFKLSSKYIDGTKPICGTADMLFYYNAPNKEDSGFCIFDWKGLSVDTPILTTSGWKTMGTISVGDYVYDMELNKTKVLHTSEVKNVRCFKLWFDNGHSIVSDFEHRWLIYDEDDDLVVKTSEELYEIHKNSEYWGSIQIPKVYLRETADFSNENKKYLDVFFDNLIDDEGEQTNFLITLLEKTFDERYYFAIQMEKYLIKNNIPINITKSFTIFFETVINSIGHSCKITKLGETKTLNYHKGFPLEGFSSHVKITHIEEVESEPTRCIEVDSPTHKYLFGHELTVTHNTNKELTSDFKRKKNILMKPPFDKLGFYDEPLEHYYLQFNLYQRMMESVGINVIARRLVHIKRDGTYEVHNVPKIDNAILDEVIMK